MEERLAACAQIIGPVESIYRWEGALRRSVEWLVVAKTAEARRADLMERLRAIHPYEIPEILASPIAAGDHAYLRWVGRESTPPTREST